MVEPVAEVAVAAFVPAAPPVHGGDELDEAPVGVVDVAGHAGDGATQFGGIVGDEIEVAGDYIEGGVFGSIFGNELGVWEGFFGELVHRSSGRAGIRYTVYSNSELIVCRCFC